MDCETDVFCAVLSHAGSVESMEQFAGYNHILVTCLSPIIQSARPHFILELLLIIYTEGLLSLVHCDCHTCTSRGHSNTCSAIYWTKHLLSFTENTWYLVYVAHNKLLIWKAPGQSYSEENVNTSGNAKDMVSHVKAGTFSFGTNFTFVVPS